MKRAEELRRALDAAVKEFGRKAEVYAEAEADALADDLSEEEKASADERVAKALEAFNESEAEVERIEANLSREERVDAARQRVENGVLEATDPGESEKRAIPTITVGREALTYRPDGPSFFRDLAYERESPQARERLDRHMAETRDILEKRDVSSTDLVTFVPPVYLLDEYAEYPRPGRPFANVLPRAPLPPTGLTINVPRITTATTAATREEEGAVSETDIDDTTLAVAVRMIAGQNDVSLELLERGVMPDRVIFDDLMAAYDAALDTQLLAGTGSSGQHLGIRAVGSINTVTYSDASPTGTELLPKIYNGLSDIHSGRFLAPTHIVLHPRRAAWLASTLSTSFPIFQQGSLNQAVGTQDRGLVTALGGLIPVVDGNVGTTYSVGGSTNEDEIYIVRANDLILMEGSLTTGVFRDVLSGTGQVRLQIRAYSAFTSGKQPESICRISGSGLVTPVFA